jgi:hypothetical protein
MSVQAIRGRLSVDYASQYTESGYSLGSLLMIVIEMTCDLMVRLGFYGMWCIITDIHAFRASISKATSFADVNRVSWRVFNICSLSFVKRVWNWNCVY